MAKYEHQITPFFSRIHEDGDLRLLLLNPYWRLLFVAGPRFSGKTSIAQRLAQKSEAPLLSGSRFSKRQSLPSMAEINDLTGPRSNALIIVDDLPLCEHDHVLRDALDGFFVHRPRFLIATAPEEARLSRAASLQPDAWDEQLIRSDQQAWEQRAETLRLLSHDERTSYVDTTGGIDNCVRKVAALQWLNVAGTNLEPWRMSQ